MSKLIYVCFRSREIPDYAIQKIENICKELKPDNICTSSTHIFSGKDVIYGLSNPSKSFLAKEENLVLGKIFNSAPQWYEKDCPPPEGNYNIFRSDNAELEILSDYLGSRNLWYYINEEYFVASSSQKALIRFTGDFKFDKRIIPWVLFNGALGPSHCWDKRVQRLPPNSRLTINKKSWQIKVCSEKITFHQAKKSKKRFKSELEQALKETFEQLYVDTKKWIITLSGGHDSRAILSLYKKFNNFVKSPIKTITWGEKESLSDSLSDANIARLLAEREHTNHKYFSTGDTQEPIDKIVERFLHNGEGAIDHITGYLDGFHIWKELYENDIEGVIRGDEIFGYNKIYSELIVRNFMGLLFVDDYQNLKKYEYLKTLKQNLPENLKHTKNESLSTWRDRIFQEYRIPYVQASLADLKYPYVEQINPFLSKKIAQVIRELPDNLRSDKKLFKEIMKSVNPKGIPYSKRDSNTLLRNAVKKENFVELLKKELSSSYATNLFPKSFLDEVLLNLKVQDINNRPSNKEWLLKFKSILPKRIKSFIAQNNPKLNLDENILAFRIYIICRMHRTFSTFPEENNFSN